jgi:hypothetical protein
MNIKEKYSGIHVISKLKKADNNDIYIWLFSLLNFTIK